MVSTYRAILKNNRLEWHGDAPKQLPPDRALEVHVTILDESTVPLANGSQGERMAAALERLAALDPLAHIADPAVWQQEARQDRPLPDRES